MTTIHLMTIKRHLLLAVISLVCNLAAMAQETDKMKFPGGRSYMFRLYFTDKQGTPYSIEHPEQFLSERALDRRRKQHLEVDSTDFPVNTHYLDSILSMGMEVVCKSKWNNSALVRARKQSAQASLSHLPFVKKVQQVWASPDSIDRPKAKVRYRDGHNSWDILEQNSGGATYEQLEMLNGNRLHRQGFRGKGMVIAVLDGGFLNADVIPSLKDVSVLGHADFVLNVMKDGFFGGIDHGTKVLSTMAANEPDRFVGAAPEASYWLLRCEDPLTETMAEEDYWAAAVEFADSVGVDVINSSLGYHDFDDKTMNFKYRQLDGHSTMISHTASMLADKGIVLVCSAGNDGMGTWKKISFPADAHDVLTVGAVNAMRQNAAFSAVGPTADGRVKPDVMAMGSPASVITGRGTISRDIGTSFSAPIVAGLVACLWQAMPEKSAREIIEVVRGSGDNATSPDNIYGYGIPDFYAPLRKAKNKTSQSPANDKTL